MRAGRLVSKAISIVTALLASAPVAATAAPGQTFGAGPRDEALVRSAVADGDPTDAATENAAFAAAEGARFRFGYGLAGMFLRVNDKDAGVAPVRGFELGSHAGYRLNPSTWFGLSLAIHRPDNQLARISFRPATEPQFVMYESALQRLTLDVVGALRYGPVSLGGGASLALGVGGPGVGIDVTQDARGPHAAGSADISLGYKLAPLVGAVARFGRLQIGASYRGELSVDLSLQSLVKVDLEGNPLNGSTTVLVQGASGYDPRRAMLGARVLAARGLRVFGALEYAGYGSAPAPVADVKIDVQLGSTPAMREVKFVEARFRDTLSPRFGVEWRYPAPDLSDRFFGAEPLAVDPWKIALRMGYSYIPSPVPPQKGFTSYADSARHVAGFGAAFHLGEVFGADFTLSFAAQFHELAGRTEKKASPALPFPEYHVEGEIVRGSIALEGAVK
ncbi:MAG: hypothetical protein U0441_11460 [Polyangiaceae bacterium]